MRLVLSSTREPIPALVQDGHVRLRRSQRLHEAVCAEGRCSLKSRRFNGGCSGSPGPFSRAGRHGAQVTRDGGSFLPPSRSSGPTCTAHSRSCLRSGPLGGSRQSASQGSSARPLDAVTAFSGLGAGAAMSCPAFSYARRPDVIVYSGSAGGLGQLRLRRACEEPRRSVT